MKAKEFLKEMNLSEKAIPLRSIKINLEDALKEVDALLKSKDKVTSLKKDLAKDRSNDYLKNELAKERLSVEEFGASLKNSLRDFGKVKNIDIDSVLQLDK